MYSPAQYSRHKKTMPLEGSPVRDRNGRMYVHACSACHDGKTLFGGLGRVATGSSGARTEQAALGQRTETKQLKHQSTRRLCDDSRVKGKRRPRCRVSARGWKKPASIAPSHYQKGQSSRSARFNQGPTRRDHDGEDKALRGEKKKISRQPWHKSSRDRHAPCKAKHSIAVTSAPPPPFFLNGEERGGERAKETGSTVCFLLLLLKSKGRSGTPPLPTG